MKQIFIIANWKSNKTTSETNFWLQQISPAERDPASQDNNSEKDKTVILCPPFTLLPLVKSNIEEKKLPLKIGSQDFSPFPAGAFTGQEPPGLIKEFADYAIIGHSERRTNFHESDELIAEKVAEAIKFTLIPVFCIQNETTPVPGGVSLVAYEPPGAIGSGNPDTPENAEKVAQIVKNTHPEVKFVLYGGSVTPENVHRFTQMENINGVLVGGASLDPVKFSDIIKNA